MKVKIKKNGKTKKYKVIESWADVTLEKWVKLIALKEKVKSEEALETISVISDIPKKLIKELSIQDVAAIMKYMSELQLEENSSLHQIITIDGKQYGFHPNLEDLTLGEYADIETFIQNGIKEKMPEIMAILYRPIVEKEKDVYAIEAYDGNIRVRAELMKKMTAEQVQGALVFFYNFVNNYLRIMLLYLTERTTQMIKKK
ncbi:MAG: hypothetical protein Tp1111DCM843611_24 [Prokaryotic dsDNA virus sp.]|nr:MAG: hypothetical protein Tp1111DCM843611_24 [Prokaryotic dsDNA virus sp.]|tara:strand:+ start:9481 stop:10083 length:603 start_codon:yes stop_codon:yes gene_type:complete